MCSECPASGMLPPQTLPNGTWQNTPRRGGATAVALRFPRQRGEAEGPNTLPC